MIRTFTACLALAATTLTLSACDPQEGLDADYDDELGAEYEDEGFRAYDNHDPDGTHDFASCSQLRGWARDADSTAPTLVQIYKDAPYPFGTFVGTANANLYRGDLPFPDKDHGFVTSTPNALKTGCPTKVFIHAMDLDTNGNILWNTGNNRLINLTGKTISCGAPPPGGCFDGPDFPIDP